MFKTFLGSVEKLENAIYLRPETAQGIFVNFLNVQSASRQNCRLGLLRLERHLEMK
jgi:glycyl-tRNA synthetase